MKYIINVELIDKLMMEKRVSLSQVSQNTEISYSNLREVMMGNSKSPSINTVAKLADYFIVRIEELIIKKV